MSDKDARDGCADRRCAGGAIIFLSLRCTRRPTTPSRWEQKFTKRSWSAALPRRSLAQQGRLGRAIATKRDVTLHAEMDVIGRP
jgi:hypothetical protein